MEDNTEMQKEHTDKPLEKETGEKPEEQAEEKKISRKERLKQELKEDLIMAAVVLVVVFVVKRFVMINAIIPSGSMENTIMVGDRVFGNRLVYQFGDPERGDIVIFKYPDNEEELFIKRVIGLPGDKVWIRDGLVYLNDSETPLEEDYLPETSVGDFGPYYVPEDCYFMLGDNRNWSKDSRLWVNTYVSRDKILAKAVFRYYPLDQIGFIE